MTALDEAMAQFSLDPGLMASLPGLDELSENSECSDSSSVFRSGSDFKVHASNCGRMLQFSEQMKACCVSNVNSSARFGIILSRASSQVRRNSVASSCFPLLRLHCDDLLDEAMVQFSPDSGLMASLPGLDELSANSKAKDSCSVSKWQ